MVQLLHPKVKKKDKKCTTLIIINGKILDKRDMLTWGGNFESGIEIGEKLWGG